MLTYGLAKKKKEKVIGDASSVMGQQKHKRKEKGEMTSPIKPKTDHDVGIIGHLDLGPSNDGQKRGKGRLKKLAREQGQQGETL